MRHRTRQRPSSVRPSSPPAPARHPFFVAGGGVVGRRAIERIDDFLQYSCTYVTAFGRRVSAIFPLRTQRLRNVYLKTHHDPSAAYRRPLAYSPGQGGEGALAPRVEREGNIVFLKTPVQIKRASHYNTLRR